jgi:ParB-like chromosome segregation protein Spo0J
MTYAKGATPRVLPVVAALADRTGALLDEWDTAIAELDAALRDAADARRALSDAEDAIAMLEAEAALTVEGRNDTERKARLLLTLCDHPDYRAHAVQRDTAHDRVREAERRVVVTKERCRLLRAAVMLASGREDI